MPRPALDRRGGLAPRGLGRAASRRPARGTAGAADRPPPREPLDALRPFALAGQGLRVLLVDQLGRGAGTPRPSPSAVWPRASTWPGRAAPELSAREQDVLASADLPEQPRRDRGGPRGLGQHDQEPRPRHLREAGSEHPANGGADRPRAWSAHMTHPPGATAPVGAGAVMAAPPWSAADPARQDRRSRNCPPSSPPVPGPATAWTRPATARSSWSAPRPDRARRCCWRTGCARAHLPRRPGCRWTPTTTTPAGCGRRS